MKVEALIDVVNEKTEGTAGDPLTRDEVESVVRATVDELARQGVVVLEADGSEIIGPSQDLAEGGDIEPPQ